MLIIGGGIAGLEAAYVLHKRGHKVVLCEATGRLGGQANIAAVPISKQELCKVVKYLKTRLEKNNIEVRLNTPVTKELIETSSEGFKKPNCEKILVETDGENPQHAGIINNFTAALLGKEELFVSGTDGIAGVELMNAISLSGWLGGQKVSLPVDEDVYLAELDKRRAVSRLKTDVKSTVANTEGTY